MVRLLNERLASARLSTMCVLYMYYMYEVAIAISNICAMPRGLLRIDSSANTNVLAGCGQKHVGDESYNCLLLFGQLGVSHPSCGRLRPLHGCDRNNELHHRDDLVREPLLNSNLNVRMCTATHCVYGTS